MEIEQTARQLETNADAIFLMAENAAYQCIDNSWGKHAQIDTFEAHCVRHVQFLDKVKDLDRYPEKMLNVFWVLYITRTLRNGTINGVN